MLYVGSDNVIWILNLTNIAVVPAIFVNTASITVTVTDSTGNTVSTFNMNYLGPNVTVSLPNGQTILGVDGNYNGVMGYLANLVDGNTYYVAAVVSYVGFQRTFKGSFQAGYSLN